MKRIGSLAFGLVLAGASFAAAQQVVDETRTTTSPDGSTTQVRKITQIIGSTVNLQDSNDFGKVEDIVLNDSGCIEYVVVSHNRQFAMLPWNVADINWGRRVVTFPVGPQLIQPLFFAPNSWPALGSTGYVTKVRNAFGGTKAVTRDVRRPALPGGAVPPPGAAVPPPGGVVPPPGAAPLPGGAVTPDSKVKVKVNPRTGTEKVKIKD